VKRLMKTRNDKAPPRLTWDEYITLTHQLTMAIDRYTAAGNKMDRLKSAQAKITKIWCFQEANKKWKRKNT
jgi:hypothetical protein